MTAGTSIWATHFIAMLGYAAGIPTSFDPTLTIACVVIAIVGASGGIAFSARRGNDASAQLVGGAAFGLSIVAMHYVGMFACRVDGVVGRDGFYIAASLIAATATAALAGWTLNRGSAGGRMYIAPGLLVVVIICLHFMGMAAFSVAPLAGIPRNANDGAFMAMAVAVAAVIIVAPGVASRHIDIRTRSVSEEQLRFIALHDVLTGLANRRSFGEALAACFEQGNGGCTLLSIDLTGHDSLKEVERYTRVADQELLAGEAIATMPDRSDREQKFPTSPNGWTKRSVSN